MKGLLDEAMRDGAIGLSTMLASPRELAVTTDDLVVLCQVVKRHGGLFSSHIRNEGIEVFDAVKEAISVGRRAQVPVDIIHLKIADQSLWGRMGEVVESDRSKRGARGSTSRRMSIPTHGETTTWSASFPRGHTRGAKRNLIARLKDRSLRDRLKHDIRTGLPGWYNHYTAVGGDWSRMLISGHLEPGQPTVRGSDHGPNHRGEVGGTQPGSRPARRALRLLDR